LGQTVDDSAATAAAADDDDDENGMMSGFSFSRISGTFVLQFFVQLI
jgi:hypothetical protein